MSGNRVIEEETVNVFVETLEAGLDQGIQTVRKLIEALPARVAVLDNKGVITATNGQWREFCSLRNLPPDCHQVGSNYLENPELIAGESPEIGHQLAEDLRKLIEGTGTVSSLVYPCHDARRQSWYRTHFSRIDHEGQHGIVVMHFDVTESVLAEQRLFQLAHFDSLTGLANRNLFINRLRHQLDMADRYQWRVGLIFIDLDQFKVINDTLGHHAGDQLLQEFAQRISSCVRKSDTVGRLGGDEFAMILPELQDVEEASHVARKLLIEMGRPFHINKEELFCGASLGISIFPDDANNADMLLQFADSAMYRAKDNGRNGFQFYTNAMNQQALERLHLNNDLRHALDHQEFLLYYQPKVSCRSGEIVGMEALLRWQHPSRGLVPPDEFIPALEELGLIVQVGAWALRAACLQLKQWIDQGFGTPTVAVNLSARQLNDHKIVDTVRQAIADANIPANCLELELTESVLMHNVDQVIPLLNDLRELGIKLSVDDFGTGYSSLSYLKRFPINTVKVDRAFVQDITADPDDASITRAVITMAHNLKLNVIAEGVETEAQLALLIANHCDEIQGYFFSRPVPADAIARLLAEKKKIPPHLLRPTERVRTILLVDEEENIVSALKRLLCRDGYRILTAGSGLEGLAVLAQNEVDVIVSGQRMSGMTGVDFLRRAKQIHPDSIRIVLSDSTELNTITDAINEGAIYKLLTKPWDDLALRAQIEEAFQQKTLVDENKLLSQQLISANAELASVSEQLQELLATRERENEMDRRALDAVQEVLQCLPLPIMGVDEGGMLVCANLAAQALLGENAPLIGSFVDETLPAVFNDVLSNPDVHRPFVAANGKRWLISSTNAGGTPNGKRGQIIFAQPEST